MKLRAPSVAEKKRKGLSLRKLVCLFVLQKCEKGKVHMVGLEIATNTVANAAKTSTLATKSSFKVANVASSFVKKKKWNK